MPNSDDCRPPNDSEGLVRSEFIEPSQDALVARLSAGKGRKYVRFVAAALGSIPWVGGFIAAAASLSAETEQSGINELQRLWLEEHKGKLNQLSVTLAEIFARLEGFGEEIQRRIESPEYLGLVRKIFRLWDESDSDEKKQMFKKLITNAGASKLCPDDLIRLFAHWIELYDETHFVVMREIYQNPRSTRGRIWDNIRGQKPREDSSEADLFRYLIRDLTTGGVIRQPRETDAAGNFLKKDTREQPRKDMGRTMESAFEDTKPYVLTELGKEFVHYVMDEVVSQISGRSDAADSEE